MITLRKMKQEEYHEYLPELTSNYAQDLADNLDLPIEQALERATTQISALLPQGLETPDHTLFTICDETAESFQRVGILWVFVEQQRRRAFIYDIRVDPDSRGKGYGRQAITWLEQWLRGQGIQKLELNVFGGNPIARHLYESMGFEPFSINMRKML